MKDYTCAPYWQPHPCVEPACPPGTASGAVLVADDNCQTRVLEGRLGILSTNEKGDTTITDGSSDRGLIHLQPAKSPGLVTIFGRDSTGTLFELGDDAPEGATIIKQGGQWVVKSTQEATFTFNPSLLPVGAGSLATFICGPNGNVRLGTYTGCANGGILVFNEGSSVPVCNSLVDFAESLMIPFCEAADVATVDDIYQGILVCTSNGVKKQSGSLNTVFLNPPQLIYLQHKAYPGWTVPPGAEDDLPGVGMPVAGYFTDETVDINLSTLAGYSANATSVVLNCQIKGFGGGALFDIVCVVDGMQYARVPFNSTSSSGADTNQIEVPIPANKTIRIQAIRFSVSGVGSGTEVNYMAVWLQCFKLN